jgi:hypothetical protein
MDLRPEITVIKLNPAGIETWRYSGWVLERGDSFLILEAYFNRDDRPFHGIMLKRGDRFVETYYTDRWYNIDAIYDRDDDALKGWYCNVTRPALIEDGVVAYTDLALDLLVYPDGRQLVLDEDEFNELYLSVEDQEKARHALQELKEIFLRQIKK